MRGFSMNIFFQKMLRCIPADVINETRSRATFRMLTNKTLDWFAKHSTQKLRLTVIGISMKAVL